VVARRDAVADEPGEEKRENGNEMIQIADSTPTLDDRQFWHDKEEPQY
jgi:hypothetical protein